MPRCVEEFSILDNGVRPAYILTTPHGSNTNHSTAPADSQQQPLLLASYLEIEILEMVNILNIVKLRKQVKVATTTKLILGTHSKNHGYIYNLLGSIAIRARVGANKEITFSQDPEESFVWHNSRGSSASHKLLPLKEVVRLLFQMCSKASIQFVPMPMSFCCLANIGIMLIASAEYAQCCNIDIMFSIN